MPAATPSARFVKVSAAVSSTRPAVLSKPASAVSPFYRVGRMDVILACVRGDTPTVAVPSISGAAVAGAGIVPTHSDHRHRPCGRLSRRGTHRPLGEELAGRALQQASRRAEAASAVNVSVACNASPSARVGMDVVPPT